MLQVTVLCLMFLLHTQGVYADDVAIENKSTNSNASMKEKVIAKESNNRLIKAKKTKVKKIVIKKQRRNTEILDISIKNGFVTLKVSGKVEYGDISVTSLPYRMLIDFPINSTISINKNINSNKSSDFLRGIRYGSIGNTSRILLNLKQPLTVLNKSNISFDGTNTTLTIPVFPTTKDSIINTQYPTFVLSSNTQASNTALTRAGAKEDGDATINNFKVWIRQYLSKVQYPLPKVVGKGSYTIVIDPGHGGKDPGSIATNMGLTEKNITLVASQVLVKLLKQSLDLNLVKIVLLRNKDHYISLSDRILWARYYDASMFISIHADSSLNDNVSGVSAYYLDKTVEDAQTEMLVNFNNKSSWDMNTIDNNQSMDKVNGILFRLLRLSKDRLSPKLAQSIISSVSEDYKVIENPVRKAPFAVLKGTGVISVLVELGFISSIKDIEYLSSTAKLNLLVDKIAQGVSSYLYNNVNTLLVKQNNTESGK